MKRRPWTAPDDALLARLFADSPTATVAARLGRTATSKVEVAYLNATGSAKGTGFMPDDESETPTRQPMRLAAKG